MVCRARPGPARKTGPRPETLAAIRQAAERYSVPAALAGIAMKGESPANAGLYPDPGGQPGLRHWDGEEWSPLLQAGPASGGPGRPAVEAAEHLLAVAGTRQAGR